MSTTTTILIAIEHAILRHALKRLLEREPGLRVVAEADDGRTAITLAAQCGARVAVLDAQLRELNGIDAARRIIAARPGTRVIILAGRYDQNTVREATAAGASGVVPLSSSADELVVAVRSACSGAAYLSPAVAEAVIAAPGHGINRPDGKPRPPPGAAPSDGVWTRLSCQEREVLQLLAEGRATKEIAYRLNLSPRAADSHRSSVMKKLEIHSEAELTKCAIQAGLTTADDL